MRRILPSRSTLDDLHLDLVALLQRRPSTRSTRVVRDLGDVEQAVGVREDLDERAEVGDALDRALVDRADLGLRGEALDDVERLLHGVGIGATRR